MRTLKTSLFGLAVALLAAGCGGGDGGGNSAGGPSSTSADAGAGGENGGGNAAPPSATPLPELPDPAPALPCDATAVLCVDASAAATDPDGSVERPYALVADAVAAATDGSVVQVAAGVYDAALAITAVEAVSVVGGFPAGGDFSMRDAAAYETVLQGAGEAAVIEIVDASRIHIEGFRITGGGGHYDGYNYAGGGVYVDQTASGVEIVGNRIDGNDIERGDEPSLAIGGGIASGGPETMILGNTIEANRGGRGAGIAAVGGAVIRGNTVRDNVAIGDHGGGIWAAGELEITGNLVEGNSIGTTLDYGWGGGIIVFGDDTNALLQGNVVTGNLAVSAGSGVFVDDGADARLVNELYYANECAVDGGHGLFVDSGGETVTVVDAANLTIAEHPCPDASLGGNAIYAGVSDPTHAGTQVFVTNSILWGNGGRDVLWVDVDVDVTYTLSEEGIDGTGNLSDDPQFADAAAGDFHLRSGSPAIDAGDPASPYAAEPDPNGGRIDLGYTGNTAEASPA